MKATGRISLGWLCACAALVLGVGTALASPPSIDDGFGVEGIVSTSFPPEADVEPFREIMATSDGGVVTRSSYYDSTEVRHYGPDGSLVKAEPEVEIGSDIQLERPEAPTPEGGRLVAVSTGGGLDAVSLYRTDGSLDPSFGSGGTSEKLPFEVQALAPLPAGEALIAGAGVLSPADTKRPPTYQVWVARLRADGKVDRSFGKAGIVKLDSEDKVPGAEALAVQGRPGGGAEVAVASMVAGLDPSGRLDPSFGKGGRAATPGPAVGAGAAAGEALLVAGTKPVGPRSKADGKAPEDLYVARYTAAGKLDPIYAGGTGFVVLAQAGEAIAGAALVGSDGSVTLGGVTHRAAGCPRGYSCDNTPIVARVTPDGGADPGFGSGGVTRLSSLTVPIEGGSGAGVLGLVARAGGGVFASGQGLGAAFVAALGTNGALDGGFGDGGLVTQGGAKQSYAIPVASGVDSAGDVYVLADTNSGTGLGESAVVLRYSPDGVLDQSYGEDGRAYVPAYPVSLAVTPEGSAYVDSGGGVSSLVKLTPSGALDPHFGKGGGIEPPFVGFEIGPVTTLRDGDLLVAGSDFPRARPWPAVARIHPDGRFDRSFGKHGVATVRPPGGGGWQETAAIAVDHRGRILLGGTVEHGCCHEPAALARFDSDGRVDSSFGHRGTTPFGGRGVTVVGGLALCGDRIFAVTNSTGGHRTRDVLYSFDSHGHIDRHFGDGGTAIAKPRDDSRDPYESVSVLSTRGRIIVARSYLPDPLVAFSPRGKLEPSFSHHLRNLVPRATNRLVRVGPAATLDGNGLILASSITSTGGSQEALEGELKLRRVLLGGPAEAAGR